MKNSIISSFKKINIENLVLILGVLYLIFLFRDGDTKYKLLVILMIFGIIEGSKNKFKKWKNYKLEVLISFLYIISYTVFHFFSDYKENEVMNVMKIVIFPIGAMLCCINLKVNKIHYNKVLAILMLGSTKGILKGIEDAYKNYYNLSWYRIGGGTITTEYAFELGLYFIIGLVSFIFYKKKWQRGLISIYIFIIIILMLLTKSRNVIVTLPIIIGMMLILYNSKKIMRFIILIFIPFLTILFLKNSFKISTFKRLETISSIEKIKEDMRIKIFLKGLDIAKENFFKSLGLYKYKVEGIKVEDYIFGHFHNNLIECLVTQRLIGLSIYVFFLITTFYTVFKGYLLEKNNFLKLLALLSFCFMFLYGQFEVTYYFNKGYQIIFTIITLSFIFNLKSDLDKIN